MKLVLHGITRLYLHVCRKALMPLELAAPRLYMRSYLRLLRRLGLRTNGDPRYISSTARFDDFNLTELGDRCVISRNVILLTHDYSVTTALIALGSEPASDINVVRPITIGRNVFLGMASIVLPGTTIGDNVIIGAGSVVRGHIPSDSVVIGNPGSVVGSISDRKQRWLTLASGPQAHQD